MSKLKTYKFSELYDFSSGISTKPEQAGHGFPFVSFSTVFNNYFLPDTLNDFMDTSENERETYSIKKGDILLTRTSETIDELAMSSVALKDYPNAAYSGFVKRLRPLQQDITYDKFMGFYLRSKLFRKTMTNNAVLTLRASLNEQIFSYLDLVLPSYVEQVKIGNLLYLLNQKIELNNKINKELEAMAKTLYDYWFVQFDFPDENGKPYKSSGGAMKYNEELKRELPDGWETITLNSLLDIDTGYSFESSSYLSIGKYKIITIKNVQHNKLNTEKVDYTNEIPNNIKTTSILNLGDILISLTGDVGRICFVNEENTLLNQRVGHIFSKDDRVDKGLIYLIMKSEMIYTKAVSIATGSNQKNLSGVDLLKLKIPFSKTPINRCSNIIKPIFLKMINLQQQNQELAKLRDWLLPMLMNGQVSVR